MKQADRLSCAIAIYLSQMPRGTIFAAAQTAIAGVRLSQELFGCRLAFCSRGGAYDPRGILSVHARHWLLNKQARAYVTLTGVFETTSEPHALLCTPAQLDGAGNANLSVIGDWVKPKVAFGGTRGLPDAGAIHFVVPSHNPRQLTKKVDFVSTSITSRPTEALLFTELCVMRWHSTDGNWHLEKLLSGADCDMVKEKTGFDFMIPENVDVMEEPSARVLDMLERIDPLHVRDLDFIRGRRQTRDAIKRIYEQEVELVGKQILPSDRIH